jgi:hypothetical protein
MLGELHLENIGRTVRVMAVHGHNGITFGYIPECSWSLLVIGGLLSIVIAAILPNGLQAIALALTAGSRARCSRCQISSCCCPAREPCFHQIFNVRKNSGDERELTRGGMKLAGVAGHCSCPRQCVVLCSTGRETGAKVFQQLRIRVVCLILHTFDRVVEFHTFFWHH